MEEKEFTCCICGKKFFGYGNNPWPIIKDKNSKCCDNCNNSEVIPIRILLTLGEKSNES